MLNVPRLMSIIKTSYPKRTRKKLLDMNRRELAILKARQFRRNLTK